MRHPVEKGTNTRQITVGALYQENLSNLSGMFHSYKHTNRTSPRGRDTARHR
jgi:hypothetical protein